MPTENFRKLSDLRSLVPINSVNSIPRWVTIETILLHVCLITLQTAFLELCGIEKNIHVIRFYFFSIMQFSRT
jgi:hypothetical protein